MYEMLLMEESVGKVGFLDEDDWTPPIINI